MPRRSGAAATLMPRIGAAPSAMLVVSLLLSWGLVNARVRAQEVQRIEMAPPGTDRIEPRNDPPMRIEARNDPPPRIQAAPLVRGSLLEADTPEGRELRRDLRALERQADQGRTPGSTRSSAQAAWLLGLIYLHGAGVPQNGALAEGWFDKAAAFGREPWAYAGVAWCAMEGCHGPPDADAARRAIVRLRATHPGRADYLDWVLTTRQTPLQIASPRNTTQAMMEPELQPLPHQRLLERAEAEGDLQAKIELALNDVANNRVDDALRAFERLARQSRAARDNVQLLQARANSSPVLRSNLTAQSSVQDLLAGARAYHRGDGRPANYVEAIRLYRLAADKGSAEARKMLELIYSRPTSTGSIDIGWMQQLAYANTATMIPTVGIRANTSMLYREPTPLFDLMPPEWQARVHAIGS